jgi:hypothetical protein
MPTPKRRRKDREAESAAAIPTHEAVARRAYELYLQRGSEHGHDWQDWFQAERELQNGAADVAA